jgi:hypothetical protein
LLLRGLEALVLPVAALPPGVDGVLGAPTLRRLPVRIDPRHARVDLGAAALGPSEDGPPRLRLPLRWQRGVPVLELDTPEGPVAALADTGAEGLFVTARLAAALPAVGPNRPLRVAGFCGEQPATWRAVIGPHLGGAAARNPVQAIVTANPVFGALGVEAIVGQELLRHRRQLWRLDARPPTLGLR